MPRKKTPAITAGLRLAAIHGWRPHILGLCGPNEARRQELLKKFLQGQIAPAKIKKVFRQFMGAYPYYKLIARSNKIRDSFDRRVIEAYWIGNRLLDKVKISDLRRMIVRNFTGPGLLPKEIAAAKAASIPKSSKPHHSFHVLTIGSVTGSVDFTGNTKLKDICRVGWGRIISICHPELVSVSIKRRSRNEFGMIEQKVTVFYQPLIGKRIIKFGKPIKKEIRWDKLIAPEVKKGDWISFHWNWLVKVLDSKELANLKKYTQNTLDSINSF